MSKTTVELNIRVIFGLVFMIIGLIMLLYVAIIAFQLATGAITPLKVSISGTYGLNAGYDVLFGILLQIGMFAIIVVIAYILMRVGLSIMRPKE
ncbi:MAG TPA: hypothetical protein VMS95_04535 [Candidatus Krumholzibacteriaceae bacterium]|jgi:hypothetical protein|nr:hypothetical protein [Candidatus Krumholzibacteriaceae bacterium]